VESGRYVAVDFRQHTEASPDCALSVQERLLADACEGLDGAVVSDPAFRVRFEEAPQDAECILVPGFRAEVPAVGSFSVFPLETVHEAGDELTSVVQPERAAADILGQMRRLQPDAVIQVDNPMDERTGYFALSGFDPTMGRHPPAAFSEDFDAIEILSGSDTGAAERLLPCWFHLLNEGRKVIVTGGSGSRGIMGDVAGIARTFVDCPRKGSRPTVKEMADAIRQLRQVPNAFVTNGPFIEVTLGGQTLGSVQSARAKSVQMRLRVLAPLWVDLTEVTVYRNGVVAEDFSLGPATEPLRCDRAMDLALDGDSWFVVCVRGKRAMDLVYGIRKRAPSAWAVTNPFWVDADGDGRLRFSP
jgi:hypothetical protein